MLRWRKRRQAHRRQLQRIRQQAQQGAAATGREAQLEPPAALPQQAQAPGPSRRRQVPGSGRHVGQRAQHRRAQPPSSRPSSATNSSSQPTTSMPSLGLVGRLLARWRAQPIAGSRPPATAGNGKVEQPSPRPIQPAEPPSTPAQQRQLRQRTPTRSATERRQQPSPGKPAASSRQPQPARSSVHMASSTTGSGATSPAAAPIVPEVLPPPAPPGSLQAAPAGQRPEAVAGPELRKPAQQLRQLPSAGAEADAGGSGISISSGSCSSSSYSISGSGSSAVLEGLGTSPAARHDVRVPTVELPAVGVPAAEDDHADLVPALAHALAATAAAEAAASIAAQQQPDPLAVALAMLPREAVPPAPPAPAVHSSRSASPAGISLLPASSPAGAVPPAAEDSDLCIICWEARRSTVLVPCGHMALCK